MTDIFIITRFYADFNVRINKLNNRFVLHGRRFYFFRHIAAEHVRYDFDIKLIFVILTARKRWVIIERAVKLF